MVKKSETLAAITIGAVVFVALELATYYGLWAWIISSTPQEEAEAGSIVRNWNKVMYFVLAYMAIMVSVLLITSGQVPRRFKRHVLFWFYLSLPMLLVMLVMAFN